ncbi:MAG: hypothetical protein AB1758_30725 [Candidatus Eremiobacterota bacterium]
MFGAIKDFAKGFVDQAVDTVKGTVHAVTHPKETLEGLAYVATHPVDTVKGIATAVEQSFSDNPAEATGRAAFEVASLFTPAGITKVASLAKASRVARVADAAADAGKVARVADATADAGKAAKVADATSDAGKAARVADGATGAGKAAGAAEEVTEAARNAGRHMYEPGRIEKRSKGITAGHRSDDFAKALEGQGQITRRTDVPGYEGIEHVQYRLYKKNPDGTLTDELAASNFEKTVFDAKKWPEERVAKLADDLFGKTTTDGVHEVTRDGVTFIGWVRDGKLQSFGVKDPTAAAR